MNFKNNDDRKLYDEYIDKVKPIVENFGGKYLVRTEKIMALSNDWLPERFIVIQFDTREQLDKCFSSDEYKQIKKMRTESVNANAVIVEGYV